MTGQIEHAEGVRGLGTFPTAWGIPLGTPFSEERASWVRRNTKVQQVKDLNKREAREIAERIQRDANAAVVVAHVKTWQKILADLLKEPDKVDPSDVVGHLQAWAAAVAKLNVGRNAKRSAASAHVALAKALALEALT
jgi:hypothetical protein